MSGWRVRTVEPEILDTLEVEDPEAVRGRRDLRRIDWFLGGNRWLARKICGYAGEGGCDVVDIGAGDGRLCRYLALTHPGVRLTGLDLRPPIEMLPPSVKWITGDVLQSLRGLRGDVAVGNLILHHLQDAELGGLGGFLDRFRVLLFSEPLRDTQPLFFSKFLNPVVGRVIRHDMRTSIRAGFRPGEIGCLLGLDPSRWIMSERVTVRGMIRFEAVRSGKKNPPAPGGTGGEM